MVVISIQPASWDSGPSGWLRVLTMMTHYQKNIDDENQTYNEVYSFWTNTSSDEPHGNET